MEILLYVVGILFMLIGLALSIGLHEIGHLVPAKLFGVRVGQYMIGFGPRLWSKRIGETEYGFKALPLGGFISMSGMYPASDGKPARGIFRTLVQDVEMTIARSDLAIAARYSALAGPLHERFFPLIRMEFDLAVSAVLKLRRQTSLLEGSSMRRSIRLRNPYVDPMNLLQVDLLRRWRQSGDETLFAALTASVNGIARGLQDAG